MSKKILLVGACLFSCTLPGLLKSNELDLFYAYYTDTSLLEVNSPSIRFRYDWTERLNLAAKYGFERFSKGAPENTIDAVSSASVLTGGSGSGFQQDRHETSLALQHKTEQSTYTLSSVLGLEEDFQSSSFALAASHDLLQRNVTIGALYAFSYDQIFRDTRQPGEKNTQNLALTLSQVTSPQSVLSGGYNVALVTGYQSNPLRQVEVSEPVPGGGFTRYDFDESHPEKRLRQTLFSRFQYYWSRQQASDANLSLYRDDWGVQAGAVELRHKLKLHQHWRLRMRHRYYIQSAADFYRSERQQISEVMSADQRLRPMDSHLSGIALSYFTSPLQQSRWSITTAYDFYRESNNGVSAHLVKVSTRYVY